MRTKKRLALVAILCVFAMINSGCARSQELRANILDEEGRSIPGAVFYAEAYTHSGTFDFSFAQAGPSGEIPAAGSSPLTITWHWGAKLALAAFAPGKEPIVVMDELGRVRADGITFRLVDLDKSKSKWVPRIALLAFPFEENAALMARAAGPKCAALRSAFKTAYLTLTTSGGPILPREREKIEALDILVQQTDEPR